ncbi:MAG: LamG domain-containing protein, partial [Caldilineaceae bacterium]|nr:LamG domain-containing protein [Caldilineaceae bacterium]
DRIYRFLKLARKLDWSFVALDWALRSLANGAETGKVLYFDGVNDFVEIKQVTGLAIPEFTVEAWVQPAEWGCNPILAQGATDASSADWLFWITPNRQLAFFSKHAALTSVAETHYDRNLLVAYNDDDGVNLMSDGQLPKGVFTHVAVTVNEQPNPAIGGVEYQLKFYINGELDATWSVLNPIVPISVSAESLTFNIGKNLNNEFFQGSIADVRLWQGIRTAEDIALNRFKRCTGREDGLLAYWPLVERPDLEVPDLATQDLAGNAKIVLDGRLGGDSPYTAPVWVNADLPLDPLPKPISPHAYHFDGIEQYVGIQRKPPAADGSSTTEGTAQNLDLQTLTLEAWVAIERSVYQPLITKGQADAGGFQYQFAITEENKLLFSSSATAVVAASTTTVSPGGRTHVAAVVTPSAVTFYIDGKIAGIVNAAIATATPFGRDLYLGRNFAEQYLSGTMQEVRIWKVA